VKVQSPCFLRYVDHITIALDGTVSSGIQDPRQTEHLAELLRPLSRDRPGTVR